MEPRDHVSFLVIILYSALDALTTLDGLTPEIIELWRMFRFHQFSRDLGEERINHNKQFVEVLSWVFLLRLVEYKTLPATGNSVDYSI